MIVLFQLYKDAEDTRSALNTAIKEHGYGSKEERAAWKKMLKAKDALDRAQEKESRDNG